MSRPATGIPVLTIEAHPVARRGLQVLAEGAGLRVVGAAAGVEELSLPDLRARPAVALAGINPAVDDPVAVIRLLTDAPWQVPCVVLGPPAPHVVLVHAVAAGALALLPHDAGPLLVAEAVGAARAGNLWVASTYAPWLATELAHRAEHLGAARAARRLSPREVDIVLGVAAGGRNADIARDLGLEHGTVKAHVSHVLTKLSLTSRSQLVAWAFRAGLVR